MHATTGTPDLSCRRILLYSHDSCGLGHLRRSLTLAAGLVARLPGASVLVASGSPCATQFALPPRVDVVKLPSVGKRPDGRYVSRSLPDSLSFVLDLRRRMLLEMLRAFRPHLLIVDNKVVGLGGELIDVLEEARQQGTRTILGLRDILDEVSVVAREWGTPEVRKALIWSYDRVCVYGSPEIFDARIEYPVPPELGPRIEFTGYVVRPAHLGTRALPSIRPQVLVTTGGGEDGAERITTYLDALDQGPVEWETTLLLGPLLERGVARGIKRRARAMQGVTVHGFREDLPKLLSESDAVVSMAGYNSVSEILQSRVPAVLLPRCKPRREQQIRARRLADLGLVMTLDDLDPTALRSAVEEALEQPPGVRGRVDLNGCERLSDIASELLGVTAGAEAVPA